MDSGKTVKRLQKLEHKLAVLVALFTALRSLKKKFVNKNLFVGKPKFFLLNTFEKGSVSPMDNSRKKDNIKLYIVFLLIYY
jgi:hypothetical protein